MSGLGRLATWLSGELVSSPAMWAAPRQMLK